MYREAREEYKKAGDVDEVCFTADMQNVIVLPKLTTKEHVFVSRLVTFYETFASKTKGFADYCVLWNESIAGRKAPDVASSYLKIIVILLWADNCSGQNKNWFVFTSLVQCLNSWGPNKITLKYLERNHIFMAADSVHGNIGTAMKSTSQISTFADFADLSKTSGENVDVVLLECSDFYNIKKGTPKRIS